MGFENLKSPAHLWVLNDSLEDTSYIWGSMSSQANMGVRGRWEFSVLSVYFSVNLLLLLLLSHFSRVRLCVTP